MFACEGAADPLSVEDHHFFHPSRNLWERVTGRPTGWRLRPTSYIWIPSSELFPTKPTSPGGFPQQFTVFMTIRLLSQAHSQGTLFSLRSRRQQDIFLSIELGGSDNIKLVHSGRNGTQIVDIPAVLGDGKWHQIAIGIRHDNSVQTYVDCEWVSTDILKKNALDTPADADLVIGYLFVGDIEQLVILPTPSATAQQCSSTRIPLLDPVLLQSIDIHSVRGRDRLGRRSKHAKSPEAVKAGSKKRMMLDEGGRKATLHLPLEERRNVGENVDVEGSGAEEAQNILDEDERYEVEWSEWSHCSVTCGTGSQTRYSRCVDDGSRLELCMEAGGEKTESRACNKGPCLFTETIEKDSQKTTLYSSILNKSADRVTKEEPMDTKIIEADTHENSVMNEVQVGGRGKERKTGNGSVLNQTVHRDVIPKMCSCKNGGVCHQKRRTCHCLAGYFGRHCERVTCRPGCVNGGHCETPDTCTCPADYSGSRCQNPICNPSCQNGGHCIKPNVCHCFAGTSGVICQNFTCRSPCLSGGLCVGPNTCECPRNATGPTCAIPVCDPPCENAATCAAGNQCICAHGTSGTRCEQKKCDYRPFQEPYTRGFRRLITKKAEAKCGEPWNWKTCIENKPEYQTVYKTFYRTVYKCADEMDKL